LFVGRTSMSISGACVRRAIFRTEMCLSIITI
jgi:hypothetical protein